MSLKLTGELCVMIMKNDSKSEKKLSFQFKVDMRNLTLTQALQNLKPLHFNGLLLTKVYNHILELS